MSCSTEAEVFQKIIVVPFKWGVWLVCFVIQPWTALINPLTPMIIELWLWPSSRTTTHQLFPIGMQKIAKRLFQCVRFAFPFPVIVVGYVRIVEKTPFLNILQRPTMVGRTPWNFKALWHAPTGTSLTETWMTGSLSLWTILIFAQILRYQSNNKEISLDHCSNKTEPESET